MKQSRYKLGLMICLIMLFAGIFNRLEAQDSTPVSPTSGERLIIQDMVEVTVEVAIINGDRVNVRNQASSSGSVISQFNRGVRLEVIARENGWVQVKLLNGTGWISQSLLLIEEETRFRLPEPASEVQQAFDTAIEFTGRNADWEPFEWIVGGISMMLVPAGCFDMGEAPASFQICFDAPFWIDKYEVTNGQFARFGGVAATTSAWSGENLPRERITWFEARSFCERRDARLPTEAEWEYAARGPSNLMFPWGNNFIADNVVYRWNSSNQTAEVGSHPGGQSWVDAHDMSGNVWEWTSSLWGGPRNPDEEWAWSGTGAGDYPYDANDGREADTGSRTDVSRMQRGGALNQNEYQLRSTYRNRLNPDDANYVTGVRCARAHPVNA